MNDAFRESFFTSVTFTQIEKVVEDCDLVEKIDVGAEKLSGGQKRKLNVGMALIGDPKVLRLHPP